MKLFYSPRPGLIHKVEVVAKEAGVFQDLEIIDTNPYASPGELIDANPLSKVPTLVRDDGVALFGGPVIYEYLDSLHDGPKMYPPESAARWDALRLLGLGDGIFDLLSLRQNELKRPHEKQSPEVLARYEDAITRGLDRLEREATAFAGFHIGLISVAGALNWLDWLVENRGNQIDWRPGRPALAAWYEAFVQRPPYQMRA